MLAGSAGLVQQQKLGLKLSPQMLQSVKLMELPLVELRERIEEELEKNPALEVIADKSTVSAGEAFWKTGGERRGTAASDEHRQFIEGAISRNETLQENLLFQLRLKPLPERVIKAGELIIQNLNPDGFNIEDPELLLAAFDAETRRIATDTVRSLDPPGCATNDFNESLSVQAKLLYGGAAQNIISLLPHMEELERGKTARVAKALKKKEDEVIEFFAGLKRLSPFPGRNFSGAADETRFILPDVRVTRFEGEFKIVINNEAIPVLGITPFFLENENVGNDKEREFIRENLKEAKNFIGSLSRRNRTIFRVSKAILHFQHDFFDRGPRYLVPLSLRDIAEKLELHETTISRAVNGKYIDTEWGVYELRRFFTNSISGAGSEGSRFSQEGVKEVIREIICDEEKSLSDNDIVKLLAGRGINLARRTVAKYRQALDLGSSYRR